MTGPNGMITHYGLFWSESDVFWGRKNKYGRLLGTRKPLAIGRMPSANVRKSALDFRDYVGLYCLYGDGELLYVGEAGLGTKGTLLNRLKSHRTGPMSGRWDSFSWFGREICNTQSKTNVEVALKQLEAISIAIINPGFNKQGGSFKGALQMYQVPHPESDGDLETKLVRLESKLITLLEEK